MLSARKQQWLLAGILGALTCLTRVNGLVLVPALLIEAAHQYWTTRRWQWQWLAIGIIGLGFGGYLLLNHHVTGDPFAFSSIMRQNFHKSLTWPWVGIDSSLGALNREAADAQMIGVQELSFIVLGLVCTIVSWIKLRPIYSVWMTINWLLFTSVTFVLSVPRYTLTMFPIFILFAMLASRRIWLAVITILVNSLPRDLRQRFRLGTVGFLTDNEISFANYADRNIKIIRMQRLFLFTKL